MKLALVSFDGIDPRAVYRNEDRMPVLHEIMEDSMHGRWRTPGHTIPSFTATLTGKQYNVTNFHWDKGKGEYQRHRQVPHDFLWEICDSSMTLLNIPVLYPPEDIEDCMVCGMLCPDDLSESNLALPEEVQDILNRVDYIHEVRADEKFDELGEEDMYNHLVDCIWRRANAAEILVDKYDSDLFYGVWTATDRWFHRHHTDDVEYLPMYEEVDHLLEFILRLIPDDIPLVIFSDHGFAHYPTDDGVHKGHMYNGYYCIYSDKVPSYRDDSLSIFDLFPTVVNYLGCEIPGEVKGRIIFHRDDQDEQVTERLRDLGYTE